MKLLAEIEVETTDVQSLDMDKGGDALRCKQPGIGALVHQNGDV